MQNFDPELVKMINELTDVTRRIGEYVNGQQSTTIKVLSKDGIYNVIDKELIIDMAEVRIGQAIGLPQGLSLLCILPYPDAFADPNTIHVRDYMHKIVDAFHAISFSTLEPGPLGLSAFNWVIDHDNDDIIIKVSSRFNNIEAAKPLVLHKGECILVVSKYATLPLLSYPIYSHIWFVTVKAEHAEMLEKQFEQGGFQNAKDQQKQNVISDVTGGTGDIGHS